MFGISPVWVGAIGFGVVALTTVMFFAAQWMHHRVWRNRFVTAFGFAAERTWQGRLFQQPEVERELSRLAREFDSWVKQENQLMERYLAKKYEGVPLRDLESWKTIRGNLENARKEFWAAHKAARVAGFSVEEKYSDYLK